MSVPTIMIGLGGIGCRAVNSIYEMLNDEQRKSVEIHAIDTDVNSIQKMPYLRDKHNYTQISDTMTVGQYRDSLLERGDQTTIDQWWPDNIPDSTTMTDGAGQIRAVSRMAYHSTMRRPGGFARLQEQIRSLFKVDGRLDQTTARVFIVSSLAGGTGAGSFIQTARYVRELLSKNYGRNVKVRGAFILPSVANRFTMNQYDRERMSANGYACLKELNAMFGDTGINIQLEYKPDQNMDSKGRIDLSVPSDPPIYDFCLLVDEKNMDGKNLPGFEPYQQQLAKILYAQVFSPMGEANMSQEDNRASAIIGKNLTARFCAATVAKMIYPYQDLLEYFGTRWALNVYGDDWLYIDQQYSDFRKDHHDSGRLDEPQPLSQFFCEKLKSEAQLENPNPFISKLWLSLNSADKHGRPEEEKVRHFIDGVDRFIAKAVEDNSSISSAKEEFAVPGELAKYDDNQIQAAIINGEDALTQVQRNIEDNLMFVTHNILEQLIFASARSPEKPNSASLLSYLFNDGDTLHPVAVRHFLYRAIQILQERLEKDEHFERVETQNVGRKTGVKDITLKLDENIKRYSVAYDDPDTEDLVENATDRIKKAIGQPKFTRLFGSKVKEFADEYVAKSKRHFKNLSDLATYKVKEKVYLGILSALRMMAKDWEGCFNALKGRTDTMSSDNRKALLQHEQNADSTEVFVLASKKAKEQFWNSLNMSDRSVACDYKEVVIHRYSEASSAVKKPQSARADRVKDYSHVADTIIKQIRDAAIDELKKSGLLNLGVVEALEKEAELSQSEEPSAYVARHLAALSANATPFVDARVRSGDNNVYDAWGLHPDSNRKLGAAEFSRIFEGMSVIESENFSKYEIIRYRALYGIKAEDINYFSDGGVKSGTGEGYDYYHRWIQDVEGKHATRITPHIDKNWHLNAHLSDFNSERAKMDVIQKQRAYIYGLLYGIFSVVNDEGSMLWQYKGAGHQGFVKSKSKTPTCDLFFLWESLDSNPAYISAIESSLPNRISMELHGPANLNDTEFAKRLLHVDIKANSDLLLPKTVNALDLILAICKSTHARAHRGQIEPVLLERLLLEIVSLFCMFYNRDEPKDLGQNHIDEMETLVSQLFEHSSEFNSMAKDTMLFSQIEDAWPQVRQKVLGLG